MLQWACKKEPCPEGEPSALLGLTSSNQSLSWTQQLCNSFEVCTWPSSLLSHWCWFREPSLVKEVSGLHNAFRGCRPLSPRPASRPGGHVSKHLSQGSIPRSIRSPGGGNGNPLQYSCLENPMDRGTWQAAVHSMTQSLSWLKCLGTHRLKLKKVIKCYFPIIFLSKTCSYFMTHSLLLSLLMAA